MLRAPACDGEPWKRALRRANSEAEARKIFAQAESALDTERETPAGADVRAARTIRMLGDEYLKDSIERGKQPLRMRSGARPGEVCDELMRRGDVVIHASDVERQDVLAAKAAHGQLVVADTREQVVDDPRHVFLSASEVMARYGWGKTKGYQNLKDRELVPAPVMTYPDRWRLDQLLAWEEKRMAVTEAALEALVAPDREEMSVTDLLPQSKRRRPA